MIINPSHFFHIWSPSLYLVSSLCWYLVQFQVQKNIVALPAITPSGNRVTSVHAFQSLNYTAIHENITTSLHLPLWPTIILAYHNDFDQRNSPWPMSHLNPQSQHVPNGIWNWCALHEHDTVVLKYNINITPKVSIVYYHFLIIYFITETLLFHKPTLMFNLHIKYYGPQYFLPHATFQPPVIDVNDVASFQLERFLLEVQVF